MADESVRRTTTSTKEVINGLLDEFEKLSKDLFEGLSAVSLLRPTSQAGGTLQAPSKIVDLLLEKDKEIHDAVRTAQEQQSRQQQINQAKEDLVKKNQEILQLQSQLKEAEQILAQALYQAKKKLAAIQVAEKGKISSEDLIKYAHRISSSNAVEAPPSWVPGDPRRPYPQDIEMRSGYLGRLSMGITGLPDTLPGVPQPMGDMVSAATTNGHSDSHVAVQPGSLSWQSSHMSNNVSETHSGGVGLASVNAIQVEVANGEQEPGVDEVEFMSTSSSSSSSDSP